MVEATDEEPPDEPSWPKPRCFAFSPTTGAFACRGLEDWVEGDGRKRTELIDLVGRGVQVAVDPKGRLEPPFAKLKQMLLPRGFTVTPTAADLAAGGWTTIGDAAVKLRVDLHEGDASFEYFGDLTVRCPDGTERTIDVRKRGLELGETATISWVGNTFAVSVHGVDGGEGHEDHFIGTVVVDTRRLCAGTPGVYGPIGLRSVGP